MRSFSTGPIVTKLRPGFGIVVDECVVDVYVGPLRCIPHLPSRMEGAIWITACDPEDCVL
jgi:hypothetical protein